MKAQCNSIHNSKKWTENYCCNLRKKILLYFIKKFFVLFSYRKLYHDYISKSWTHPFVHCIVLRRSAHTTSQPKNGWFFEMKWSPFFLRFSSANAMKKQRFLAKFYYVLYIDSPTYHSRATEWLQKIKGKDYAVFVLIWIT